MNALQETAFDAELAYLYSAYGSDESFIDLEFNSVEEEVKYLLEQHTLCCSTVDVSTVETWLIEMAYLSDNYGYMNLKFNSANEEIAYSLLEHQSCGDEFDVSLVRGLFRSSDKPSTSIGAVNTEQENKTMLFNPTEFIDKIYFWELNDFPVYYTGIPVSGLKNIIHSILAKGGRDISICKNEYNLYDVKFAIWDRDEDNKPIKIEYLIEDLLFPCEG